MAADIEMPQENFEDEDFLMDFKEDSPKPQRKLKRLKKSNEIDENRHRSVHKSIEEDSKVVEDVFPADSDFIMEEHVEKDVQENVNQSENIGSDRNENDEDSPFGNYKSLEKVLQKPSCVDDSGIENNNNVDSLSLDESVRVLSQNLFENVHSEEISVRNTEEIGMKRSEENNGKVNEEDKEVDSAEIVAKKKRKAGEDRQKLSSDHVKESKQQKVTKKQKKAELEKIHSESQRLLRETPNVSFKPQPMVQKPITSLLEKIRQRTRQLDKKWSNISQESVEPADSTKSGEDSRKEGDVTVSDESEKRNDTNTETEESAKVSLETPSSTTAEKPDNCDGEKEKQNFAADVAFRPPVLDSEDPFCDSLPDYMDEELKIPSTNRDENKETDSTKTKMNLKLDSFPDEELHDSDSDEDEKENVKPSLTEPIEAVVHGKSAPGKAFVDDEAEDEDDDNILRHSEDGDSSEDDQGDLEGLIATAEERENEADLRRRDELHRKWLEQQDAADTNDILLRLGSGKGQRNSNTRRPAFLDEDDDTFCRVKDDNTVLSADKLTTKTSLSDSFHDVDEDDDDTDIQTKSLKEVLNDDDDDDDKYVSSEEEDYEEKLMKERVLQESEEKEAFISPVDDDTSREIFSLIKKLNVAPTVKRKPKATSAFHEIIGLGSNSNSSSKSSFLGRPTTSCPQVPQKQRTGGTKSYIFGRDDSNSRHAISKLPDEVGQKENTVDADTSHKMSLSQNKSKQNELVKKGSKKESQSSVGLSLFEILRRQSLDLDKSSQKESPFGDIAKQTFDVSHLAIKSVKSIKTVTKSR